MKANVKLQTVDIENESLKKVVAKLEDEIQECKKASLDKIELKETFYVWGYSL